MSQNGIIVGKPQLSTDGDVQDHTHALSSLLAEHKESLQDSLRQGFERNELLLRNIFELLKRDDARPRYSGVDPYRSNAGRSLASGELETYIPGPSDRQLSERAALAASELTESSSHPSESALLSIAHHITGGASQAMKTASRMFSKPSRAESRKSSHGTSPHEEGLNSVHTADVKGIIAGATEALKTMSPERDASGRLPIVRRDEGGQEEEVIDSKSAAPMAQQSRRWRRARSSTKQYGMQEVIDWIRQNWRAVLLSHLINGGAFRLWCSFIILVDGIIIGIETDHTVKYGDDTDLAEALQISSHAIVGWYVFELCLRIVCEKPMKAFFVGKDMRWNMFDLTLVIFSLMDFFLSSVSLRELAVVRILRVLRLIRVMRVLRIFRFLTFLREFHKLVLCLASSLQTLLCAFSLMTFFIFGMSILFTQTVGKYLEEESVDPVVARQLQEGFGSVGDSMLSLYMAITAGRNWGEQYDVLEKVGSGLAFAFVVFLVTAIYGLTNVVTAVFVESAMQATQNYRDLLVQEMLIKDRANVKHMKEIFRSIDTDNSGAITLEEMHTFLQDDTLALQEYFEALDLTANDTESLFKLLDMDDSGEVDIDEFCDGCMRLGGPAKSFDINCMWYEQRRTNRELLKFVQHACTSLHALTRTQAEAMDLASVRDCAKELLEGRIPHHRRRVVRGPDDSYQGSHIGTSGLVSGSTFQPMRSRLSSSQETSHNTGSPQAALGHRGVQDPHHLHMRQCSPFQDLLSSTAPNSTRDSPVRTAGVVFATGSNAISEMSVVLDPGTQALYERLASGQSAPRSPERQDGAPKFDAPTADILSVPEEAPQIHSSAAAGRRMVAM